VVKDGATIGANAVVLPGVVIGKRAMIAAGAVVDRDVPDDHIFAATAAWRRSTRSATRAGCGSS
jgi:acetyltransferase-like isoleucine patch superfamily enzyme